MALRFLCPTARMQSKQSAARGGGQMLHPPQQALWRGSGGTNGCRNVVRDGPGSCHDTDGLPIRLSVLRDTWRAAPVHPCFPPAEPVRAHWGVPTNKLILPSLPCIIPGKSTSLPKGHKQFALWQWRGALLVLAWG